ncbi:histidine phosphatase family protein [Aurantimonas sp. A2-1-M11]|uniref:SixA phosphatase family protein n=1 Tax=Aurantimonas sp. A2-1-M11 TaxID=3113712 RepID=UPI002F95D0CB
MSSAPPSRLYILRHAHSGWARPGESDHDRPLDARGHEEVGRLTAYLRREAFAFDAVVCSTAVRTRETLDLIRPVLPTEIAEQNSDALYGGGVSAYFDAVRGSAGTKALLVVGHNPMIEEFTLSLAGTGDSAALATASQGFPTGGLAILEFPGPLSEIAAGTGDLRRLFDPDEDG